MGTARLPFACFIVLMAIAPMAFAKNPPPSGAVEKPVFSAAAAIPPSESQATLTQLAEGSVVIVTQFCKSGGDFGPQLAGSLLGVVPSGGTGACTSYEPGVRFAGPQTVVCFAELVNDFSASYCLINGYIESAL